VFVSVKRHLLRAAVVAAILFLMFAAYAFPRLGRFLVYEDPLVKADVIYVLNGSRFERQLEAVDLYNQGWAPLILLSKGAYDWGELELLEKGVPFTQEIDIQIDVMHRLGVPKDAIVVTEDVNNSTHAEAQTLVDTAALYHWKTAIVVSSKQHTRRARMEMNRMLAPRGMRIVMRASTHDRSNVDAWWTERGTIRFTLFETQRLLAYWLRLAN
jgi:uncharacterized SAM-binding protein YcdF (DUF218 family)